MWLDPETTGLPVPSTKGAASVPSARQKPHWLRKRKNVASKEHICNKLSKHGFDVREGVYTWVTKETCTHGDFVVPGRLPRALNPGVENPFEDPSQRLGISKNIIITQQPPPKCHFTLFFCPPPLRWLSPVTERSLAVAWGRGRVAADVHVWITCCYPSGPCFPVALASTGHFWGWPPRWGNQIF